MRNKILVCILSIIIICFTGCKEQSVEWSYKTAILNTDNEYFKTNVLIDDGATFIVQNEITGEIFYGVSGIYGITLTPIEANEVTERGR